MTKIAELHHSGYGTGRAFLFMCPGCGSHHIFQTHWNDGTPAWKWNGDFDKPTVHPSVLVTTKLPDRTDICHSFITSGRIQFLTDSTHALAGKTVDLPDMDD